MQQVSGKDTSGMNFALIQGEKGFIHVKNGANGCRKSLLHVNDQVISSMHKQIQTAYFMKQRLFSTSLKQKIMNSLCMA
ncbi:hypothetical protein ACEQPO_29370 [Bacillus sp. SL00103]